MLRIKGEEVHHEPKGESHSFCMNLVPLFHAWSDGIISLGDRAASRHLEVPSSPHFKKDPLNLVLTTNVLNQALQAVCLPAGEGLLEVVVIRKSDSLSGKENTGNDPKFWTIQVHSDDSLSVADYTHFCPNHCYRFPN